MSTSTDNSIPWYFWYTSVLKIMLILIDNDIKVIVEKEKKNKMEE